MAKTSPLLARKRLTAFKAETNPGTAEALTAAEATMVVFDTMIQQQAEMAERMKQGGFGRHASVVTNRLGRATFNSHLFGGSATPAGLAALLPACGLGLDGTSAFYQATSATPDTAASTSKCLTLGAYIDGVLKKIFGAMGTCRLSMPAGKLATAAWDFLGIWAAPSDVALLAPTYSALKPLRVVSAALTLGAYGSFRVANVGIDFGNTLYAREDVDADEGVAMTIITDRLTTVTLDPEATLIAQKDIYGEWLSGAEADLSVTLANDDGDGLAITASDLQIINPQQADRNGLVIDQLECQVNTDDLKFLFS